MKLKLLAFYLIGLAAGFATMHYMATTEKREAREKLGYELVHDGWCSLMPSCHDRCHCHDRCGALCNDWRRLVAEGKVEPFGYDWTLNDPTGLVECIIHNSKPEPRRVINGWELVE